MTTIACLAGLVQFATKALRIDDIKIETSPSAGKAMQTIEAWRIILVNNQFLQQNDPAIVAMAVFHEVGHIYAHDKFQGTPAPTEHEGEYMADWISGWLSAAHGVSLGGAESPPPMVQIAAHFGATIFDGFIDAPLSLRTAVSLGLNESPSHPAGSKRALVFVDGYMARRSGQPPKW